jgi:hypothetical protein
MMSSLLWINIDLDVVKGDDGGLNIPTVLSPVKESEGVPSRSASGSVIGRVGSLLMGSFTRRS